jgi:hypothetical protein
MQHIAPKADGITILFKKWQPADGADFDISPCGRKCHHMDCLDSHEAFTVWHCPHGSWFMPNGNGGFDSPNMTWGDEAQADEEVARAKETPAQTAARLAAALAREEASHKGLVKFSVSRKEDKWTKGGEMKFRVPRPCKYASLFLAHTCPTCNKVLPASEDTCSNGHLPEKLGGCWSHEQKGTCIYVHPDEPQWAHACSGELCYDRQRQVFHLKGETPPAAAAASTPNRFQAAASAARPQGGRPQGHGGGWTTQGSSRPHGGAGGGYGGAAGGGGRSYGGAAGGGRR